ncbi:MAG: V-type ATPase subunit [Butyrivibrio sp.]|nr:V-type ATPase subunit [Butyrivibrio sp.]
MSEEYIYAVARIRGKELSLLNGQFMDSLIASKNYQECLRLLSDHGWDTGEGDAPEVLLKKERDKTWQFISELVPDMSVFDVFLYANDYHNLKAAVKEVVENSEHSGIYMEKDQCTIDPRLIQKAMQEREYSLLPTEMQNVAKEALDVLLHTGDGQLCDVIIDKAALERIYESSKKVRSEIMELYGELTVASADIKTAIRACRTGKDKQFLERALAQCDSLDIKRLAEAAVDSLDAIYEYLERTTYSDAVSEIKKSPSAFERWCDNRIIESIRPQIHNPFTIGPLAAYILARENEIKTVRIILSGKINDLAEDSVRERVREMYV